VKNDFVNKSEEYAIVYGIKSEINTKSWIFEKVFCKNRREKEHDTRTNVRNKRTDAKKTEEKR